MSIKEIASFHGRSNGGIKVRLKKLRLIEDDYDEKPLEGNEVCSFVIKISGTKDNIDKYLEDAVNFELTVETILNMRQNHSGNE